ncbi:MAG TPA: PH domain-containing protein [Polyangia bacterium]|jgi:uncharacterized membrane protein YdbT with pleckstrin-like domain
MLPSEETLWEGTPSRKALAVDAAGVTLWTLALSLAVGLAYRPALQAASGISPDVAQFITSYEPGLKLAAVLFVVVVAGQHVLRLGWRAVVLRAQSYRLTNQRLLIESGVFSRTINEIDLRTVDDITFHQRFSERLLGLGQIGIVSSEPDPTGPPRRAGVRARLVGVREPREVREQIRNAAYAASGKQVFMRPT